MRRAVLRVNPHCPHCGAALLMPEDWRNGRTDEISSQCSVCRELSRARFWLTVPKADDGRTVTLARTVTLTDPRVDVPTDADLDTRMGWNLPDLPEAIP